MKQKISKVSPNELLGRLVLSTRSATLLTLACYDRWQVWPVV